MVKYYAAIGREGPKIYTTWEATQKNVSGFSGARHKSFARQEEAQNWIELQLGTAPAQLAMLPKVTSAVQKEVIYTDGSHVEGRGGWAYVVVRDGKVVTSRYGPMLEYPTTNNRAELMAILQALQDYSGDVIISPDSRYAMDSVSVWASEWEKRGWKKANGQTPENLDLIRKILELQKGRKVEYRHVYGHTGNQWNELADQLANQGRKDGEMSI